MRICANTCRRHPRASKLVLPPAQMCMQRHDPPNMHVRIRDMALAGRHPPEPAARTRRQHAHARRQPDLPAEGAALELVQGDGLVGPRERRYAVRPLHHLPPCIVQGTSCDLVHDCACGARAAVVLCNRSPPVHRTCSGDKQRQRQLMRAVTLCRAWDWQACR